MVTALLVYRKMAKKPNNAARSILRSPCESLGRAPLVGMEVVVAISVVDPVVGSSPITTFLSLVMPLELCLEKSPLSATSSALW